MRRAKLGRLTKIVAKVAGGLTAGEALAAGLPLLFIPSFLRLINTKLQGEVPAEA